MGATAIALNACCPLCGSPVLAIERNGRVVEDEVHAIRLGRQPGRGYTLCDDCAILAILPEQLTLN